MQPTRESNTRSIGKPFDRGTAWMRLLAAYFVVLIHAAWRFSAAEVIWLSAARFSVPLFVIISGFYLLASPQPGRKLIEKTLRLLWLMLFWSAVYYLYVRLTGTMSGGAAALAVYLLTQPVHLWYLYAAAALYLFTPVFFVFAEHAGRSVYRYALFLCFLFGSVITILLRSESFPLLADIMDKTKIAALLGFPGLFLLGGYFRRFPTARRGRILLCVAALFSVAATAAWTWRYSAPKQQIEPLLMSFFAPGAVLPAAALFAVLQNVKRPRCTPVRGSRTGGSFPLHVRCLLDAPARAAHPPESAAPDVRAAAGGARSAAAQPAGLPAVARLHRFAAPHSFPAPDCRLTPFLPVFFEIPALRLASAG